MSWPSQARAWLRGRHWSLVWTLPFPVSKELLFLRSSRVWGGVRAFPAKTSFEPIAQLNRSGQCLSGSGLGCRQGFHRILGLGLVFGLDLTFGVRFRVLVLSRACVRSTCQLTNAIKGGKNGAFSITQSEVESLVEILDFFVAVRVSSSALATALLKTAAAHDI